MYSNNRDSYRQTFFNVWEKLIKKLPLDSIETQLAEIIEFHPEYHAVLENSKKFLHQEFALEENPFFHMSLHITLREQLRLNRPSGISEVYRHLCNQEVDSHEIEHRMMQCLVQVFYQAQQSGEQPDEKFYLRLLKSL